MRVSLPFHHLFCCGRRRPKTLPLTLLQDASSMFEFSHWPLLLRISRVVFYDAAHNFYDQNKKQLDWLVDRDTVLFWFTTTPASPGNIILYEQNTHVDMLFFHGIPELADVNPNYDLCTTCDVENLEVTTVTWLQRWIESIPEHLGNLAASCFLPSVSK